jgi:hypothetical protein
MAETHAETFIARDADEVWKVAGDFHGLKTWFPGLQEVTRDSDDVRVIAMGPGIEVRETQIARDDANRRLTYKVESKLFQANKYETTLSVTPCEGGCTVAMDAVLDPDDMAAMIGPVYEGAVQGLADHFK